jgi:hypothetical protein
MTIARRVFCRDYPKERDRFGKEWDYLQLCPIISNYIYEVSASSLIFDMRVRIIGRMNEEGAMHGKNGSCSN